MTDEKHNVIVLFDHLERGRISHGKQYLVIFGTDGVEHLISEKRQPLWNFFLEQEVEKGHAFLFVYETFNNVPYVADIKGIPNEWQQPIQELGMKATAKTVDTTLRAKALELAIAWGPESTIKDLRYLADLMLNYITETNLDELPRETNGYDENTPSGEENIYPENVPPAGMDNYGSLD